MRSPCLNGTKKRKKARVNRSFQETIKFKKKKKPFCDSWKVIGLYKRLIKFKTKSSVIHGKSWFIEKFWATLKRMTIIYKGVTTPPPDDPYTREHEVQKHFRQASNLIIICTLTQSSGIKYRSFFVENRNCYFL